MMHERYLEITYRHGRPLAAYLYLPRRENDKSHHVIQEESGLMMDITVDGRPIGIEIVSPRHVSLTLLNEVLAKYALPPLDHEELAPIAGVT